AQLRWQEPQRASGAGTMTSFEEVLEGPLTFANATFWGRLELRFEPVKNLLAFVSARDRHMPLQWGQLLLYAARTAGHEPGIGEKKPAKPQALWTYAITGGMRVLQPSHDLFGGRERFIDYALTVASPSPGGPLPADAQLLGRKTLRG